MAPSQGAWWLWTPAFTFDSIHSQVQFLLYLLYDKVLKGHPLGRPNPGKSTFVLSVLPSLDFRSISLTSGPLETVSWFCLI